MVRIKERYLLVNILYPSELGTNPKLPDVVLLNQPTTDALTPQALVRGIRAEIAELFGDFGSGAVEGSSLVGEFRAIVPCDRGMSLTSPSQVKYLSPFTLSQE